MLANLRSLTCAILILSSSLPNAHGQQPTTPESLLARPLVNVWRRDYPRILNFSPATSEGRVYTAVEGGGLTALDINRGMEVWRTEVGGEISAAPLADDNNLYVATRTSPDPRQADSVQQGTLRCLTAGAGLTRWVADFPDPLTGSISAGVSALFSLDTTGSLVAYHKGNGAQLWRLRLESKFVTEVVARGESLFVGTQGGGVFAVEQRTGAVKWRRKIPGARRISALSSDGRRVFAGAADGRLHTLDSSDGALVWTKRFGGTIGSALPIANNLIVTTLNNFVYNVETERGRRVWKKQTAGRIAATPLADGVSVLIASASDEASVVFRVSTGKVVNTIPVGTDGASIAHVVLTKDTLIFTTSKGVIGYAASGKPARRQPPGSAESTVKRFTFDRCLPSRETTTQNAPTARAKCTKS